MSMLRKKDKITNTKGKEVRTINILLSTTNSKTTAKSLQNILKDCKVKLLYGKNGSFISINGIKISTINTRLCINKAHFWSNSF